MAAHAQATHASPWQYGEQRFREIWENLSKNNLNLSKRMLKNVVATTAVISISLIDEPNSIFGKAAYISAMTTVFAYPGRRFGQMVESLLLAVVGGLLGTAWSSLGIYLGSLVLNQNPSATFAIRGVFFLLAVLFHGFLRSRTPRLFTFVLLMIIICITGFTTTSTHVTHTYVTQLLYPVLMAAGVILIVNICIFPEFSSRFLGTTTIETLNDTANTLTDAGHYFIQTSHSIRQRKDTPIYISDENPMRTGKGGNMYHAPLFRPSERTPVIAASLRHKSGIDGTSVIEQATTLTLSALTSIKIKLRAKLISCQDAQSECQFEIAFSVLPPRYMRGISKQAMKRLVGNTTAIIGACESRYALLGEVEMGLGGAASSVKESSDQSMTVDAGEPPAMASYGKATARAYQSRPSSKGLKSYDGAKESDLELIKPKREIEFADVDLLRHLLERITNPYLELEDAYMRTVRIVISCIAFAYDVPHLPSGAKTPVDISLEELDLHLGKMQEALEQFDEDSASALDGATALQVHNDEKLDLMPREEVFLISSFLLNIRQATMHLLDMAKRSRHLVQQRKERKSRRRLYAPRIRWRKWLYSGNQEDESLPTSGRKEARRGVSQDHDDEEIDAESKSEDCLVPKERQSDLERALEKKDDRAAAQQPSPLHERTGAVDQELSKERLPLLLRIRARIANTIEWVQESEDLSYAIKLAIAEFIVTWPAFVPTLNSWFSLNRGAWASLQLVFVFEIAIGTSVMTFFIRAIGTTLGSLWGWAAYEARSGNPIVCTAVLFIGLIPCAYLQLGTKNPKAGMVSIISMSVVALSTELHTVPGTATENFLKRWIAFMIGGIVALIVEIMILPVKARNRLIESLAASIKQISEMEGCIAFGIEEGTNVNAFPPEVFGQFDRASRSAKTALGAADTFLPFCSTEPRLKGSFAGLALIYGEILFVLRQIVDRMDNMLQLRIAYGSGPLEEFNAQIFPYRRNVAGSITLVLFAVHEALTTRLPLPQFLPSARLAHLRMINKIREVVPASFGINGDKKNHDKVVQKRRRKYMSWNASSAAQAEVIEYLEELTDLTKLLVGANEFRSGLLTRPTYREYAQKVSNRTSDADDQEEPESKGRLRRMSIASGLTRRRAASTLQSRESEDGDVPISLRRIQSRKSEAGAQR